MATTAGAPYNFPVPQANDIADVPTHFVNLANAVAGALEGKASTGSASAFQRKIIVRSSPPLATEGGTEGDVIFVI